MNTPTREVLQQAREIGGALVKRYGHPFETWKDGKLTGQHRDLSSHPKVRDAVEFLARLDAHLSEPDALRASSECYVCGVDGPHAHTVAQRVEWLQAQATRVFGDVGDWAKLLVLRERRPGEDAADEAYKAAEDARKAVLADEAKHDKERRWFASLEWADTCRTFEGMVSDGSLTFEEAKRRLGADPAYSDEAWATYKAREADDALQAAAQPGDGAKRSQRMKNLADSYAVAQSNGESLIDWPSRRELFAEIDELCVLLDSPPVGQAAAQPVTWCHRCGEGVVPGMPCRSRPVDASCPRATPPAGERSPRDLLHCRQHGKVHHMDCRECRAYLDERLAYADETKRGIQAAGERSPEVQPLALVNVVREFLEVCNAPLGKERSIKYGNCIKTMRQLTQDAQPFTYAQSGPRLELDGMIAALVQAVYDACEKAATNDEPLPAIDDVGLKEGKAIQRWAFKHLSGAGERSTPAEPLTDAQVRELWEQTFSTENPFNPVTLKAFAKTVRATEKAHRVGKKSPQPKEGEQP